MGEIRLQLKILGVINPVILKRTPRGLRVRDREITSKLGGGAEY